MARDPRPASEPDITPAGGIDDEPQDTFGSPGLAEAGAIPWPMLLRRQLQRRLASRFRVERRWMVVLVVLSGLFAVSCTITILVVSLERVAADLHTTVTTVNWSLTGPMLAFGVVGPAFGRMGDMWGHKRVFVSGLLLAGMFAVATALAWNAWTMIGFRTASAACGSACGPSAMAYINHLFRPYERVRPLSYWSFVGAVAPVLGVVLGASIVEAHGWRVIFWGQAPLCIAGAAIAWRFLPDTTRRPGVRFDVRGSLTLGIGAVALLSAINQVRPWGLTDWRTLTLAAAGACSLIAFVVVERTAAQPLVVLQWFKTRNVALPMCTQFLANFTYMGSFILVPLLLQRGLGMRETQFATLITARPIAFAVIAPLAGIAAIRYGERAIGVLGSLVVASSCLAWLAVDQADQRLLMCVALGLAGLGLGASSPAMTSLTSNAVEPGQIGVVGAMHQLFMQIGAVTGATVMTAMVAGHSSGELGGFHQALVVGAVVAAGAAVTASFVRSTPRGLTAEPGLVTSRP